jgi:hypothetical protein
MTSTPRLHKLAWGDAGIAETVEHMWAYVLGYDPDRGTPAALGILRGQAEEILRAYRVQFYGNALHAAAIHDWIQQKIAYVGDHVLIEELRAPAGLVLEIQDRGSTMGDCDDFVILEGALLAAIGIPIRIVTISTRRDRDFNHTYLIVDTNAGPIVADPILKGPTGRPLAFGTHVPPTQITNYEESDMPPSLEALGVNPMEGALT